MREIIIADVSTAAVVDVFAVAAAAEMGAGSVSSLSDIEVIITTSLMRKWLFTTEVSCKDNSHGAGQGVTRTS